MADRTPLAPDALRDLLGVSPADEARLAAVRERLAGAMPAALDEVMARLTAVDEVRPLLGDHARQARLRASMRACLESLGHGIAESGYPDARMAIGLAHERIGLRPSWFIAALVALFDVVVRDVLDDGTRDSVLALQRAFGYDACLAIEAYHRRAMERLESTVAELDAAMQRLERLAAHDELTGALNRRAAAAALEQERQRSVRSGKAFAVVAFDVDGFKRINDEHGHGVGDRALVGVVESLRRVVRPWDVVARFGGDEFVIGLGACGLIEARAIAERIRQVVAGQPLVAHPPVRATVSAGVAAVPAGEVDRVAIDALLAAADRASYAAKRAGRDRVSWVAVAAERST